MPIYGTVSPLEDPEIPTDHVGMIPAHDRTTSDGVSILASDENYIMIRSSPTFLKS